MTVLSFPLAAETSPDPAAVLAGVGLNFECRPQALQQAKTKSTSG